MQKAVPDFTDKLEFAPYAASARPWTFLTAAFLHSPSNYLHILFNMYALWICGQYLEPLLGRVRFLALYLVSALGGSVGYLLLAQPVLYAGRPDCLVDADGRRVRGRLRAVRGAGHPQPQARAQLGRRLRGDRASTR